MFYIAFELLSNFFLMFVWIMGIVIDPHKWPILPSSFRWSFYVVFQMLYRPFISSTSFAHLLFWRNITDQLFISGTTMALPYWMESMWVFHFNVSMFQVSREGKIKNASKGTDFISSNKFLCWFLARWWCRFFQFHLNSDMKIYFRFLS